MTSQISTKLTAAQPLLESTYKWVFVIGAVVAAGFGLADILGLGSSIAEAAPPPRTPTDSGGPE
jgi:hypothetical protein